jgi:hypothetical protein
MNPFRLSEDNGGHLVPCSKCLNCKRRRASSWSIRLVKEGERSTSALFVTLTYDTKYVPITKNGYMNLSKTDLQKFFKRLRKCHENLLEAKSIKYYAAGEYGGKTKRPHYHIVLFNANAEYVNRAWALDNKPIGNIHIGTITEASIGYTLKYISKASQIPMHKNDDRQKEFSLMSKGLGANYLSDKMKEWHKNDVTQRVYIPLKCGKKAPMPRYFKEKLYNQEDKEQIAYYFQKKAVLELEQKLEEYGENYQKVREEQFLNGKRKMLTNYSDTI